MKKILTIITSAALVLSLSACSSKNAVPQGGSSSSSASSSSSTSTYTMKAGDDLASLQKDGVIPDLSVLGIDISDFKYSGEEEKRGKDWLYKWAGDGEKPAFKYYKYSKENGDYLMFDKYGRLRYYYNINELYEFGRDIPDEERLSENELYEIGTEVLKTVVAVSSDELEFATSKDPETDDRPLLAANVTVRKRNQRYDECRGIVSISPSGEVWVVHIDYINIPADYDLDAIDKAAEEWYIKKCGSEATYSIYTKYTDYFEYYGKIYGLYSAELRYKDYNEALPIIIEGK